MTISAVFNLGGEFGVRLAGAFGPIVAVSSKTSVLTSCVRLVADAMVSLDCSGCSAFGVQAVNRAVHSRLRVMAL